VRQSDFPGPLVNTLTVTATDNSTGTVTGVVSATVNVGAALETADLTVSADTSQARLGDRILYTYRITNTGPLALTVTEANDDHAGAVAGLLGVLAPGATRSASARYVVQPGDFPGPLVNEVVVMTDDGMGDNDIHRATTAVTLLEPFRIRLPRLRH
jgi:hypothetical protein